MRLPTTKQLRTLLALTLAAGLFGLIAWSTADPDVTLRAADRAVIVGLILTLLGVERGLEKLQPFVSDALAGALEGAADRQTEGDDDGS